MRTIFRQAAGAIACSFMLLVVCAGPVHATSADAPLTAPEAKTALQISPSLDNIVGTPGDIVQRDVTVKNLSDLPLPIKAYTRSFVATDEDGGTDYPDDADNAAAQHWFGISTPDFILQPGASKVLHVIISIPDHAEPGGHYATFFVESLVPKEVLSASSLYLATRVGALYFFVIAGDVQQRGSFEKVVIPSFMQHGPVPMQLHFQNSGNVHLQPVSTITITDWRGREVYKYVDDGKITLPGKARNWEVAWDHQFLFGRYKVTIDSDLGRDIPHKKVTRIFWAAPLTQIAIFGSIFLLIAWILIVGRGRFRRAFRALGGK